MSGQPRAQAEPLAQRIRLGMPQLCGQGLSEHWLLKTAGDLHWQALAATHGCRPSALQDAQGRRVYAAFTLVHLRGARLREVDEDQTLDLRIAHQPLGRSRHFSQQWAQGPQGEVAQLSLLTAAVVRERAGDNHTVARVPLPTGPMAADPPWPAPRRRPMPACARCGPRAGGSASHCRRRPLWPSCPRCPNWPTGP
jgi:probable biosynthetic protein (TIGR04099 family)